MRYLTISTSLKSSSRSRVLAQIALQHLEARTQSAEFIDLAHVSLPFCDAAGCFSHPDVLAIAPKIQAARGIIIASPIYNYDLNSAAKNLVELTGRAWNDKVVGFVCAAGGHGSYMSLMPFANSLMLDFRCVIIPRFVYAPSAESSDEMFGDEAIHTRVDQLTQEMIRVTDALHPAE